MKLSEVKQALTGMSEITFQLEDGTTVAPHFHVTEVGNVERHFIDCGGTIRKERSVNFQLYTASDYDHRLAAPKLLSIIELSERKLGIEDAEVEVEYQGSTIGKYGLEWKGGDFLLTNRFTDCLAKDNCGIPQQKPRIRLSAATQTEGGCCTQGGGCC